MNFNQIDNTKLNPSSAVDEPFTGLKFEKMI